MISREEAVKHLEDIMGFVFDHKWKESMDMAIGDMQKQIPKKPYLWGDGYADGVLIYDMWDCPNCEKPYEVDYEEYKHCPNCGQAIDWGEEE